MHTLLESLLEFKKTLNLDFQPFLAQQIIKKKKRKCGFCTYPQDHKNFCM
ncbi:hypothetical protein pah_c004o067 [Parachlamydia acanthamoebae str. Hall's coccus]|nr:hypothetical protein pah_c004o067 [Parachlamydia acanthamoebae str. Hall's coccus]